MIIMKMHLSFLCVILIHFCTCFCDFESNNNKIFIDFSIRFCKFRRRSNINVFSDDIQSKENIVKLVKYLNLNNIFTHFFIDDRKVGKPFSIQTTVTKIDNLQTLNEIIVDGSFLRENKSEWLIYLTRNNISEDAHKILESTNIWIETNIFLAYPTAKEKKDKKFTFSLFKYYKINHKGLNGKVTVSQNLTLDKEWFGIKTRGPSSNSDTFINVGICCDICQYDNFYKSNTNNSEAKDVDKVFKEGLNQLLVSIMTIAKARYTRKCFTKLGRLESNNDSMLQSIVSNSIDIGFEPMYINSEELNVIDMSWPVAKTRGYVYYRNKMCIPKGKLYSFPFKTKLLICILIISAICGSAAAIISCLSPRIYDVTNNRKRTKTSYRSVVEKNFGKLTIGDVFLWFVQPFTSQTGTWFPDSLSGRILSIFFLTFTMTLGQMYSEYISIFFTIQNLCYKSVGQVTKSGDFNLTYVDTVNVNFNNIKNDIAKTYFKTANRVENAEYCFQQVLYGNWAVYIRGKIGREYLGSWKSPEKCSVSENYMPHSSRYMIFPMRKTSLYKNLISYSFTRLYESGVMSKIKSSFYGNLPLCQRYFTPYRASFNDIYPALYMLIYGALASILICFFEGIWHRH